MKETQCNIIAGGESLKGFDLSLINKFKSNNIAVNYSYRYVNSKYLVFWDKVMFKESIDFKGISITLKDNKLRRNNLIEYINSGKEQFEMRKDYIAGVNNSGYMALNAAVKLGFTEIYLFGYDFYFIDNKHFYDNSNKIKDNGIYERYIKFFEHAKIPKNIIIYNVINSNQESALNNFEKITYQDYINKFKL